VINQAGIGDHIGVPCDASPVSALGLLKATGLDGVGKDILQSLTQPGLIAFDAQQVVGTARANLLRRIATASNGINAHQTAAQLQRLKQSFGTVHLLPLLPT